MFFMSSQTTKSQYVNDLISQLPQAVKAIGSDKLSQWAAGQIGSSERDREFAIYQAEGLSQHLKNVVLCYLNLPSVGYSDFSDNKKVQGDQYRGYLARARAVYDSEVAQLTVLQTTPGIGIDIIQNQQNVIAGALSNYKTWLNTYLNAIISGSIV